MMQISMPSWASALRLGGRPTFIFSYVLESECEACVLSLDDTHFSKGALSDDSQQAEVVEIHCEIFC
jgi:hypothetical protein